MCVHDGLLFVYKYRIMDNYFYKLYFSIMNNGDVKFVLWCFTPVLHFLLNRPSSFDLLSYVQSFIHDRNVRIGIYAACIDDLFS